MRFLSTDTDDLEQKERGWEDYRRYLASNSHLFPSAAFAFATATWHYDIVDFRCPHDSWVEELVLREMAAGSRSERRRVEILVRLLGAWHNGHLLLIYRDVRSYDLSAALDEPGPSGGHRDWLLDEIRLSDSNLVVHEVRFASGVWLIACADIEATWLPRADWVPSTPLEAASPSPPSKVTGRARRESQHLDEPERVLLKDLALHPGGRQEMLDAVAGMALAFPTVPHHAVPAMFAKALRQLVRKEYVALRRYADWRLALPEYLWVDPTEEDWAALADLENLIAGDEAGWRLRPDQRALGRIALALSHRGHPIAFALVQ